MPPIVRLLGAIQHYEWGSHTVLAELLGDPSPSARPQAELWLGAHPRGESLVVTEQGEPIALGAWIARDPVAVLGAGVAERFGGRLPFLLKILAVERALSLQAHPDADQARRGFARESGAAGGGERLYVDPEAKPELVVAHTRFRALCGLRSVDEVRASLARVGLGELASGAAGDAEAWLRGLLAHWLAPEPDPVRDALLARALAQATDDDPAEASMRRLAEQHPDDPGVLAPLLLHEVVLEPGEALFLEAGELHCYLQGVAAELMGASDNVLRAGLTRKPRAVSELLRVGTFAPRAPRVLRAGERAAGVRAYDTPADCFELSTVEVGERGVAIDERSGVEILLCHAGLVQVAGGAQPPLALDRGQSCLVPAAAGPYRLEGSGRLYRATVPAPRVTARSGR